MPFGTQLPAGTAVVSYTYDNGTDQKGHLTHLADQAGTADFVADSLGRLTQETRVLTGANNAPISKSISYEYELGGSVRTLHYPSGAAISYAPDSAGRLVSAVDSANSINYASGATYQADGQMTGFISGNTGTFAGITNAFNYNRRLQPINMSANAPSQTVFSIGYDFNVGNGTSGADNGNVYHIYNFRDRTRDQTFGYDGNNRLISAQNAGTDCTQQVLGGKLKFWGNNYTYDPWGNLNNKVKIPTACAGENLSVVVGGSNRITSSGYGYDIAGNMTTDGTELVTLHYDPENRADTATKAGVTTSYVYDADGNRAKKTNGSTGTLYWYMTPGIIGESDLAGTMKSEYVFFNGERVARRDFPAGSVAYYFSDHLKTASVITDSAGVIKAESDYYPWGGELQFVNADSNHYKFTGKERDTETQLDYFGARYYSNGLGRFITPDWAAKPAAVPYAIGEDPQSLNLYAYVRNAPIMGFDIDGHFDETPTKQKLYKACTVCRNSNPPRSNILSEQDSGVQAQRNAAANASVFAGILKTLANTVIDLTNLGNQIACTVDPGCQSPKQFNTMKPSDPIEGETMRDLQIALLVIPGAGEEEAAAQATYLYARFTKEGEFLKWGITDTPLTRYTKAELSGGTLEIVTSGSREQMLRLERWLTERAPGPQNLEQWAGSKYSERGLRAVERVLDKIWKGPL